MIGPNSPRLEATIGTSQHTTEGHGSTFTPGAISLSVPSPQSWPVLDLTDKDFNQIVNPPVTNSMPTYIMDFGLDEFQPSANTIDGELVKDGAGKCKTENVTDSDVSDSEIDSDTEYESSETENETSSEDEEEDKDAALINNLCKVTKTLKMA